MTETKLSILEFVESFEYKVLTSISEGTWENRVVTKETLEDAEYMKFLENEIKVRRVKR